MTLGILACTHSLRLFGTVRSSRPVRRARGRHARAKMRVDTWCSLRVLIRNPPRNSYLGPERIVFARERASGIRYTSRGFTSQLRCFFHRFTRNDQNLYRPLPCTHCFARAHMKPKSVFAYWLAKNTVYLLDALLHPTIFCLVVQVAAGLRSDAFITRGNSLAQIKPAFSYATHIRISLC